MESKRKFRIKKRSLNRYGAFLAIPLVFSGLVSLSSKSEKSLDTYQMEVKNDSIASRKAFMEAYAVLKHPRCMNCHPSGDVPLQGDDSHIHTMLPQRGIEGKGVYAMKCKNCHQDQNTPGLHTPPGNPNWHLPPANMKMVFQGKSPRELAIQLLNPKTNGGKNKKQLIEHVTSDSLVLGGWNPGEGRTLPPVSHEAFAASFKKWIETGAYIPVEKSSATKKRQIRSSVKSYKQR